MTKLHNLILELRSKLYDCHTIMQDIDIELKKLETVATPLPVATESQNE